MSYKFYEKIQISLKQPQNKPSTERKWNEERKNTDKRVQKEEEKKNLRFQIFYKCIKVRNLY